METKLPNIVYSYLYSKLKKKETDIIKTAELKEIVRRCIIATPPKGLTKGGDMKGIPKIYTYDVIKDLEERKMITRIDHQKYRVLDRPDCLRRLKPFPF